MANREEWGLHTVTLLGCTFVCWRALRVSAGCAAWPGPHTPRQLPVFDTGRRKSGERRTVCWRKMDSNHRSLADWSPLLDFVPFHCLEHGRLVGFDDTLRPAPAVATFSRARWPAGPLMRSCLVGPEPAETRRYFRPAFSASRSTRNRSRQACQLGDTASGSFGGNARGETLLQLGSQRRLAQGLPPVRHRRGELIEEVIDTADPAGKMKGQMWPHQGPAQPRPGTDRRIDIGNTCHALSHQMQRLPP